MTWRRVFGVCACCALLGCKRYPEIDPDTPTVPWPDAGGDALAEAATADASAPAWDARTPGDVGAIAPWGDGGARPVLQPRLEVPRCPRGPAPLWTRTYGTPGGDESFAAVAEFASGALVAGGAAPLRPAGTGAAATWWALSLDAGGVMRTQSVGVDPVRITDAKAVTLGRPVVALLAGSWVLRFDDGAMEPLRDLTVECDLTSRFARGAYMGGVLAVGTGNIRAAPTACRSLVRFGIPPVTGDLSLTTPGLETGALDGVVTPEGHLFVVGWARQGPEGRQVFAAEALGAAPTQWYRTFGEFAEDTGVAAGLLADGTRLMLATVRPEDGVLDRDVALFALRADGSLAWARRYGADGVDEEARDLLVIRDGLAIVAGRMEASGERPWLLRTELDGALIWTSTVGEASVRAGLATATRDGAAVLSGTTLGAAGDGWLAKVMLNAACP